MNKETFLFPRTFLEMDSCNSGELLSRENKEGGYTGLSWLARDRWRALVNAVMKLRVP
jgi:hypothetical protein